jgi:hypothetical protein
LTAFVEAIVILTFIGWLAGCLSDTMLKVMGILFIIFCSSNLLLDF